MKGVKFEKLEVITVPDLLCLLFWGQKARYRAKKHLFSGR
jgi:hypothetical protein